MSLCVPCQLVYVVTAFPGPARATSAHLFTAQWAGPAFLPLRGGPPPLLRIMLGLLLEGVSLAPPLCRLPRPGFGARRPPLPHLWVCQ